MIIHASDIKSWSRCPQAFAFDRKGIARQQLSGTAFGSVVHHALHVLERENDVEKAVDTFDWYWHPENIEAVCEPVEIWLPKQGYGSLRTRGIAMIREYAELTRVDDCEKLALEYEFVVPLHGTVDRVNGGPLYLGGTIDKLNARFRKQIEILEIADFKTGKKPTYLRHNIQGTAYAYASTLPEFWMGLPQFNTDGFGLERGLSFYSRFQDKARLFTWIDLSSSTNFADGGWRGPKDYERLMRAAQAIADSIQHGIYPLTIEGEVCAYCPFRVPCGADEDDHGNPVRRVK
jgi:CRISPR/Cas system-associated exonuclease Cas4 (RecB family)